MLIKERIYLVFFFFYCIIKVGEVELRDVTKKLIINFNIVDSDFMGFIVDKESSLSFHHIIKKQCGGKLTYNNGAILVRNTSHNYLHIIESRELDMYIYINKILKDVNNQGYLPTHDQLRCIFDCLEKFERDHSGDTNTKVYPLIKESFQKRIIL